MTKQYTTDEKAEAVKKFLEMKAEGKSIKDIEKELGINNSSLYHWSEQAKAASKAEKRGTVAIAVPPAKKQHNGKYSEETKQQAVQMAASGISHAEIQRQLNLGAGVVAYWVQRNRKRSGELIPAKQAAAATGNGLASKLRSGGEITDALLFLRQAEREIMEMVRDGKIARPDQAHLLTLLALGSLQKALAK